MPKKTVKIHDLALRLTPAAAVINTALKVVDGPFKRRKMDMLLAYNPPDNETDRWGYAKPGRRDKEVSISVTICNRRNSELPTGTVEYNVGDGLPGERSMSLDFYDLDEALKIYNQIVKWGWKKYFQRIIAKNKKSPKLRAVNCQ